MEKGYKKLGEILIKNGVLTEDKLNTALEIQKKEGGLIGEILLKNSFVSEQDIIDALIRQCDYLYLPEEEPLGLLRKKYWIIAASLFLTILSLLFYKYIPFTKNIDHALYGALLNAEYALRKPPSVVNEILLVTIDNETIEKMAHHWPYPRADFATVIENLKKADPRAIAIDFVFYGKMDEPEDVMLRDVLKSDSRIVAAANLNQRGELDFSNSLAIKEATTGIITKLQDQDGG